MKSRYHSRIIILSVLILLTFVIEASAQTESPAIRYYQAGTRFVQTHEYEMAVRAFRASVHSDPKFAEAWAMLAAALFDLDYWEDAENCMRKAIELKPEIGLNPAVKEMLAILSGKQPAATENSMANPGEKASGEDATEYFTLGMTYGKKGDDENAIKSFYTAVRIDPNFAEAWIGLGVGLYELGDSPEALKCIRRGVELKPVLADNSAVKAVLQEAGELTKVQQRISNN
jgi:tetratricopeptide (TPR) repeat protein